MLELNIDPFPELHTERLLLRRPVILDAPEIFFFRSDESVMKFIKREPAKDLAEAEEFVHRINRDIDANEAVFWAITLKNAPEKVIGNICLWNIRKEHYRAELGYLLHPDFWRKGIMKEAITKVVDYGFTKMHLHSIEAHINPDNLASAAVLEATGFVREAYFKEDFFYKGKFHDTAIYSLLTKTA